jgi:hypothetical protein
MDARAAPRRWRFESLPKLSGWSFWAFAAFWTTTLAVAVLANIMVAPGIFRNAMGPAPASAMAGLSISSDAPWPTLGPLVGPEAARAGLRRGDRLVAIDGRPVAAAREALSAQFAGPAGTRLTVTTQSAEGIRVDHVLTRDPGHYQRALADAGLNASWFSWRRAISWLVDACLFLGCAILLMARRSSDPLAPWASLMMLWMMIAFGEAGEWFANLFAYPSWAAWFANATAFSLLGIVLTVFPTGRFEPRWSLAVAVLGTLATVFTTPLAEVISNSTGVVVYAAAVAATAARYRGMAAGEGRQQIRWALLGFAGSVVAIAVLVALQVAQGRAEDFGLSAWLSLASAIDGVLIFALLILGITVSLMRYRLYDADATISRTIAYSMLTISLLALFAGSEKVIEILGEQYFGERLGALSGALAAAVAAVMIVPIHHRVTHWAEHRFRSGLAHMRHGLPLLVGDLRETASPQRLAEATLARVKGGVRASHGALVVDGAVLEVRDIAGHDVAAWLAEQRLPVEVRPGMICERGDPLFPMRVLLAADDVGEVGWLLLGPRPDGSFYGREERAALREIADPVARALAIALERERRDTARRERDEALVDSVHSLRERVGALRSFVLERYGFDAEAVADGGTAA